MRRIASDYNADRKDLFTAAGWASLGKVELRPSDRFVLDQLHAEWQHLEGQLRDLASGSRSSPRPRRRVRPRRGPS